MKLLLTDCATLKSNNDLSLDCFKEFGTVTQYDNINKKDLIQESKDTDIILCNKTIIDNSIIENATKLKYIGIFATGYNNIDIKSAKKNNITVCNAGSYSTNAVVQQVMGFILMHYTKIPQYDSFVKKDGWKNSQVFAPLQYETDEVATKTLGIIGYGNIGKALEKAALGLNMNVIVYTRTIKENGTTRFVDFDTLLKKSDIVSLHCPLNNETQKIMNHNSFNKMKNGSYFINTSRGGTVDEDALYNALLSGKLSGTAIDVLNNEPMNKDSKLIDIPNLTITPHVSWAPLTTRKRLINIVYNNIVDYLNNTPHNVIV